MAFRENLGNNMVMRPVADEGDIERFVAFNTQYNNLNEGQTCDCVMRHHPGVSREDFWLVEDESRGEIVSTTCLIPWTCRYADTVLRVAMLEMVLTHPAYRGQGLVRKQIQHFLHEVNASGFDLSIIWGIPYYYRQYGYGYCLDGDAYESLPAWQVPANPTGRENPYRLRPASVEDIPLLTGFYQCTSQPLQIWITRDAQYWDYLLRWAGLPVAVIEDKASGAAAGYVAYTRSTADRSVSILESSVANAGVGWALLRLLKADNQGEIRVAWPENNILAQLARSLGSRPVGGQWLLRIPDMPRFLEKIAPELEKRLAASAWQGLTTDLIINFYREAFKLRFVAGKLAGVEALGFVDTSMGADGGHLCIPPDAFLRLAFGYRSLEQLADTWPDMVIKPEVRHLVESLFPRMTSYLHTPYHYMKEELTP